MATRAVIVIPDGDEDDALEAARAPDSGLGLAGFTPKAPPQRPEAQVEALRQAQAKAGFRKAQPSALTPTTASTGPGLGTRARVPRRATEQRQQFNLRAYPSVIERFSALAAAQHWQLAVAFEQAVAALEEKLAS